jgi:hypothetical protein
LKYRAIGGYSLHEKINNNRNLLIDFAMVSGMSIKSLIFPHKDIHKYTWISPDENHRNQIDHVLINFNLKNCITNIRTLHRVDMDSDHLLMGIWIKMKLRKMERQKQVNRIVKYDIEELKNKNIDNTYKKKY